MFLIVFLGYMLLFFFVSDCFLGYMLFFFFFELFNGGFYFLCRLYVFCLLFEKKRPLGVSMGGF